MRLALAALVAGCAEPAEAPAIDPEWQLVQRPYGLALVRTVAPVVVRCRPEFAVPGEVVTVEIAVPQKLSKQAKEALEQYAEAMKSEDPREELLQRAARAPRIEPEP